MSTPTNYQLIKFPDHSWAGGASGHDCALCVVGSPWRCDVVAHRLGENEAALRILNAVEALP